MQAQEITAEIVAQRLVEAVEILKRLRQRGHRPQYPRSQWPDVIRDYWDAYGQTEAHVAPVPPNGVEIDEMDEVIFHWLPLLWDEAANVNEFKMWQRILWAYANGHSYDTIARMFNSNGKAISGDTIRRKHARLLDMIVRVAT